MRISNDFRTEVKVEYLIRAKISNPREYCDYIFLDIPSLLKRFSVSGNLKAKLL